MVNARPQWSHWWSFNLILFAFLTGEGACEGTAAMALFALSTAERVDAGTATTREALHGAGVTVVGGGAFVNKRKNRIRIEGLFDIVCNQLSNKKRG